jgi:hypothetical protein
MSISSEAEGKGFLAKLLPAPASCLNGRILAEEGDAGKRFTQYE